MELIDRLNALSERARQVRETIETEEATKNALILPFLSALGYDVFDPAEVNPEFTADVGVRKHEKVDYAICIDGEPVMLVECKNCGAGLDGYSSQLFRYFSVTPARIAILTDGIAYRFYSDLAEPNKLDSEPFLTVSVEELRSQDVKQLERFQRGTFDTSSILEAAEELRYSHAIRTHFARELEEPSDVLLRHFIEPIYSGRITSNVLDRFREVVKRSLNQHVREAVERRLQQALRSARDERPKAEPQHAAAGDNGEAKEIETTMEELQGFYNVRAVLREHVDLSRVVARDVQSYFGVLLDDNNRKPICRLHFNGGQRYLGVFDADKNEDRIAVTGPDDIFAHATRIADSLAHALHR